MHFTGGGIGASGELRPMSLGLGSSRWIGGRTGAPAKLPEVIGRGDCLVGLIPDLLMPWELCGGDEWFPLGVASAENDGYALDIVGEGPCLD